MFSELSWELNTNYRIPRRRFFMYLAFLATCKLVKICSSCLYYVSELQWPVIGKIYILLTK